MAEIRIQSNDSTPAERVIVRPPALTVARSGEIVVAQRMHLVVFDSAGRFLRRIGRDGQGPGEYREIGSLGWLGDTLWVYDRQSRRLTLLDLNGTVLGVKDDPPNRGPAGSRLSPAHWLEGGSMLVGRSFTGASSMSFESSIDDRNGRTLVTLSAIPRERITTTFNLGGRSFQFPQPFSDMPLIVAPPSGEFVVYLDRAIGRLAADSTILVRRYGPNGNPIATFTHSITPRPLGAAHIDSIVGVFAASLSRNPGAGGLRADQFDRAMRAAFTFPRFFPAVHLMNAGDDGSIWLTALPDLRSRTVLDGEGRLVHRVRLPEQMTEVLHVTRDRVWVVEFEAGMDVALVRYRVGPSLLPPP